MLKRKSIIQLLCSLPLALCSLSTYYLLFTSYFFFPNALKSGKKRPQYVQFHIPGRQKPQL